MREGIGLEATIARREGWVVETLGADMVMLDPERDRYLRVNRTGAFLWQALEQPATVGDLAKRLAGAEGVPRERAEEDTLAFVARLIEHGAVASSSRDSREAR